MSRPIQRKREWLPPLVMQALAILLLSPSASAWTDMELRGEINASGAGVWGNVSLTLQNGVWRGTIAGAENDSTSEFKYYSSNDGGKWFGHGATVTPPGTATLSSSGGNSNFNEESGKYYTFTAKDASSLNIALQKTSASPVGIGTFSSQVADAGKINPSLGSGAASTVHKSTNGVTANTSATPGSDEKVYVAYSTNNFSSDFNALEATGTGATRTATLPAVTAGTTVHYYTLTSTWTSGITSDLGTDHANLLMRSLAESSSSRKSYTTYTLGNAFHLLEQTAGTANEKMLAGSTGTSTRYFSGSETEARIYSGNVFAGAADVKRDQTGMTLWYKIGINGTWTSMTGAFSNESGNDKYWVANLGLTNLAAGYDIVYYYLQNHYANETTDKTYVFATTHNDPAPRISGFEGDARAMPFHFVYGSVVPEPATAGLLGIGALALWLRRRHLNKRA